MLSDVELFGEGKEWAAGCSSTHCIRPLELVSAYWHDHLRPIWSYLRGSPCAVLF